VRRALFEQANWATAYRDFVSLHKQYLMERKGLKVSSTKKKTFVKRLGKPERKPLTEEERAAEEEVARAEDYKIYLQHIADEKEQTKLDMLIIVDATMSMKPYIGAIKDAISNQLVTEINRRFPHSTGNIRYGVLAYRDVSDPGRGRQQFEKLPFTPDVGAVQEFLEKIEAVGGDDFTEDVVGAMREAQSFNWESPNRGIFHVCDAPGHGAAFHDLGPGNDNFLTAPPPGREDPEVEARAVLRALASPLEGPSGATGLGVQRYMLSHLNKGDCAKMTRRFQQILEEECLDKTVEGSTWMLETEVKRDPGAKPDDPPSKIRLDDLVGRLTGAVSGTISSGMSRVSQTRSISKIPKVKEYEPDLEAVAEEPDPEPSAPPDGPEVESPPHEDKVYVWAQVDGKEEAKRRGQDLKRYTQIFKKMRGKARSLMVDVSSAPDYMGKFEDLLADIDDSTTNRHDVNGPRKERDGVEMLIRREVPPGWEGSFKVGFLAQFVDRKVGVVPVVHPDGRVKYHEMRDRPIVVLKEYKTAGKGENSAQRYKKECKALGAARCLADEFNKAVEKVQGKLPPDAVVKKLRYLDTKMVHYLDKPVGDKGRGKGKGKGGGVEEDCSIFRLMEPLILGTFTKWSSNAGYVNAEDWQEMAHAFSHWSFHASNERLLIADIQGVQTDAGELQLTDPQIHCRFPANLFVDEVTKFGLTGMRKFFSSHTCGPVCKALGLEDGLDVGDRLEVELAACREADKSEDEAEAKPFEGMGSREMARCMSE